MIDGDGNAAALSSTLGSGSGVFRGGFQLNNMLGELDVIGTEPRPAGDAAAEHDGADARARRGRAAPRRRQCRIGAALRCDPADRSSTSSPAELPVEAAIEHPRLHVEDGVVQIEGGWADETAQQLQQTRAGR